MSAGVGGDAPSRLADVIERLRTEDAQATFTTAEVVAGSDNTRVAVDMAGETQRWPFVAGYTPRIGDAVVLGGAPGWWVCLGSISGVGPQRGTTGQYRDLDVDHDLTVGHDLTAQSGIRSNGGLSCADDLVVGGRARAPSWSSSTQDGAVRWSGAPTPGALEVMNYAGTTYKGVFCSNVVEAAAPSWSHLKTGHVELAEALGEPPGELIDRLAGTVTGWRYDQTAAPDIEDQERHVGLMLDELPDVLVNRALLPVRDEDGEDTGETIDRSTWDVRGMVSVLLVELAKCRQRLAELEEREPDASSR